MLLKILPVKHRKATISLALITITLGLEIVLPSTIEAAGTIASVTSPTQPPQSCESIRHAAFGGSTQFAGVAFDAERNSYASDSGNARVLRFSPSGRTSVFAGGSAAPKDDFETSTARFYPTGLAFDTNGGLFIADAGYSKIRKVTEKGQHSIVAGDQKAGFVDGPGGASGVASFNTPLGIALDGAGNLYVADSENNAIRRIDRSLNVTTLAGNGAAGFDNGPGGRNGMATFNKPSGVAVNRTTGTVFVSDTGNNSIRKIDTDGNVTTFAGNGAPTYTEGTGGGSGGASFHGPTGLAIDANGILYVADSKNKAVRKIDTEGFVTTKIPFGDGIPFAIAVDKSIFFVSSIGDTNRGLLRTDYCFHPKYPSLPGAAAPPKKPAIKRPVKKARIASKKAATK
jgi:DNA-binding beta-propeller fold protein YncE